MHFESGSCFLPGHVTIGGSICMELLTRSGWKPTNDIEVGPSLVYARDGLYIHIMRMTNIANEPLKTTKWHLGRNSNVSLRMFMPVVYQSIRAIHVLRNALKGEGVYASA